MRFTPQRSAPAPAPRCSHITSRRRCPATPHVSQASDSPGGVWSYKSPNAAATFGLRHLLSTSNLERKQPSPGSQSARGRGVFLRVSEGRSARARSAYIFRRILVVFSRSWVPLASPSTEQSHRVPATLPEAIAIARIGRVRRKLLRQFLLSRHHGESQEHEGRQVRRQARRRVGTWLDQCSIDVVQLRSQARRAGETTMGPLELCGLLGW